MVDLLAAIATAFGVVFVAELGDKTQLLALGFGARHRLSVVALGLTLGYAIANVVATIVGAVLGAALPERPIGIAAGILFLGFALWTLRGDDDEDDEDTGPSIKVGGVVMSIALSIAIAEMGDKTQLATAALAARNQPIGTWIGATAGAASAGLVGALFGQRIGRHLSDRTLRYASAGLFAVFGVLLLVTA
ncbi:MAG: TMEM165/GDT1 family protein [Ilumatobacteraceae bacterium]